MVTIDSLGTSIKDNMDARPNLKQIAYESAMDRARFNELHKMFYEYGPGNGTFLSLAFDQIIEHGVGHFFKWENSADPKTVIELANKAPFSALAIPIGLAEKYQHVIKPGLPLIVKVDGHFLVGDEVNYPRHSIISSIERAVKCGATAIGFTMYFGGEELMYDVERVQEIIETAHAFGKPVVMWAYARGPLAQKMGADSLYWTAQAVAAAEALGVDVVKQKFPMPAKNIVAYKQALTEESGKKGYFYKNMPEVEKLLELEPADGKLTKELAIKRLNFLSQVAPNSLKIISGGAFSDDVQGLMDSTTQIMESGCEGRIMGRNLWGRPLEEAIELTKEIVAVMKKQEYKRKLKVQG